MTRVELGSIVSRQKDSRAVLAGLQAALGTPVVVADSDGRVLLGNGDGVGLARHPVRHEGRQLGWVEGTASASAIAALLEHLIAREVERKALGAEVLHLYREINLIYSFSEKLAALLELDRLAQLTLRQARHLIVATDGVIMLMDEPSGVLSTLALFGDRFARIGSFQRGVGIVGTVAATGIAEVVDDIDTDPRRVVDGTGLRSLICAPLKVGERVIGVIALASTELLGYTAAELKLLNTLAPQTATAIENARLFERTIEAARERERLMALHEAAEVARAKLESEMVLAARIQADLFPSELPAIDGYELAARNRPAWRCGGDYYDALRTTDAVGRDHLLLCVADVSGKGVPASLLMSNMQATLRALLGRMLSLPALADEASRLIYATTSASRYVTAALLDLDAASGDATFVGAGHLDNFVLRRDGNVHPLSSTGTPLGLLPVQRPYEQASLHIGIGDCLALYSDGVTEALNSDGDEFGDLRLQAVVRSAADAPAHEIVARVFDALDAFTAETPQYDDITLMILKRLSI